MSLIKQLWSSTLQENLYPANDFVNFSVSHDDYVTNNVVYIPQAGGNPTIRKNPTFPLTNTERTDSSISYTIDYYSFDPTVITNPSVFQIAYDKRLSVMQNTIKNLNVYTANELLKSWSSEAPVVSTSGATSGDVLAGAMTGTRKRLTKEDLFKLQARFDSQNIPKDGRKLILPTAMYYDLIQDNGILQAYAFGTAVMPSGYVPRIAGFDLIERSEALVVNGTSGAVTVGSPTLATDKLAGFAWHPSVVAKAKGGIDTYINAGSDGSGDANYHGIIVSGGVWFGGKYLREDKKGIAVIAQG